MKIPLNIF